MMVIMDGYLEDFDFENIDWHFETIKVLEFTINLLYSEARDFVTVRCSPYFLGLVL
jgi:hypothetical protein